MNDPAGDHIDQLAAAIQEYLSRYPDARDTVAGVREWWLPAALRGSGLPEVEQALWRLVAQGKVVPLNLPNGTTLFAKAPPTPGSP